MWKSLRVLRIARVEAFTQFIGTIALLLALNVFALNLAHANVDPNDTSILYTCSWYGTVPLDRIVDSEVARNRYLPDSHQPSWVTLGECPGLAIDYLNAHLSRFPSSYTLTTVQEFAHCRPVQVGSPTFRCNVGWSIYADITFNHGGSTRERYVFGALGFARIQEQCPIAPLSPITDPEVQRFEDNPDLSDTARLSRRMQTALQCLQTAIGDAGGTSSVGSAYRPPAYNQHLIEVWRKWMNELKEETNPACQTLRAEVQAHFRRHKLLESQPPVPGSLHTKGEAFDLTSNLPYANLDALARGCQVYRNIPRRDRVHFIHR